MIIETDKIPPGISLNALRAIVYCNGSKRRTIADVARHLKCTPANMTPQIDRWAKNDLFERQRDENDRRKIHVVPTDRALNLIDHIQHCQKS